jgi:hypothetical protein
MFHSHLHVKERKVLIPVRCTTRKFSLHGLPLCRNEWFAWRDPYEKPTSILNANLTRDFEKRQIRTRRGPIDGDCAVDGYRPSHHNALRLEVRSNSLGELVGEIWLGEKYVFLFSLEI